MKTFGKISDAILWTKSCLIDYGRTVKTERWQGIPSPDDMFEYLFHSFKAEIPSDVSELIKQVNPNLPWADEHFEERICGLPLNPPPSHVNWPFSQRGNEKFGGTTKFSHSYPERIWPKYGELENGLRSDKPADKIKGIRYEYGDFGDVIDLLEREPFTRQAFLPIWFPEDTGTVHGERVPCTIGYHFIRRGNYLHVVYYIRSCDYRRHFRDDIYLACRKVQWAIERLKEKNPSSWNDVVPGYLSMHITSLHCFDSEKRILKQSNV
jgi:hypothetical protein